jgi:glutamate synthase (NADPH/NADH) small chain
MPEQALGVRCTNFNEVALGYTEADAIREAMRCLNCRKKPCTAGCPIGQRIPEFIARVAEGDFAGAYEIISSKSCLPAVCAAQGEAQQPQPEKKSQKVAVIGSGPAGIACAGDLADLGYQVTIFEKLSFTGGILTYGIPQFVLPNTIVEQEIEKLKARGVEIVTQAPVDKNKSVDALFAEGYSAIFVGSGADVPQTPRGLDTSLAGVWSSNDYLTQVNLHTDDLPASIKGAKRVLVVGGGNTAVDAVRCARRLGAETTMVYRRTLAEAPARKEEIGHTYEENITIKELSNPVECYGENGVLVGVKCEVMKLGEPDASGRRSPVGTGEYFDVPCDNLVIATGTTYSDDVVGSTTGIDKDKWGGIATDESGKTSRPGVFAGGDAVTGPLTVVHAMGAGKKAAVSIDQYLSNL